MGDSSTIGVTIAAISLALNGLNFFYTNWRLKGQARRQRLVAVIDDFIARTRETSEEMERHLTFQDECKDKAEMFRLEKKCRSLYQRLCTLFENADDLALIRGAYLEWYSYVYGDGFPVEKAGEKIGTGTGRYSDISKAQQQLETVLNPISGSALN